MNICVWVSVPGMLVWEKISELLLTFFWIRNAHIVERQEILENIWFMFLLAPATAGHLVMLCLGVYDPQGEKKF